MIHYCTKKQANAIPCSLYISNRARKFQNTLFQLSNINITTNKQVLNICTKLTAPCWVLLGVHIHSQQPVLYSIQRFMKICSNYSPPFPRTNHSNTEISEFIIISWYIKKWYKRSRLAHLKKENWIKFRCLNLVYMIALKPLPLWKLNSTRMAHFKDSIFSLASGASSFTLVIYDL